MSGKFMPASGGFAPVELPDGWATERPSVLPPIAESSAGTSAAFGCRCPTGAGQAALALVWVSEIRAAASAAETRISRMTVSITALSRVEGDAVLGIYCA